MEDTPAVLSYARAREVMRLAHGYDDPMKDSDQLFIAKIVAAMFAFAKEATPPASDAPASGAGATFEVDDRGLFCRHCGRSSVRHHRVNGVGNFCEPDAAPKVASEAAGLREADAEALAGYRAAASFIAADAWDGCSDCIAILRAARAADWQNDQAAKPDETARQIARIRLHAPALTHPAPSGASGEGKPFAYFQRNEAWNTWEEVTPEHKDAHDGIVAAYRQPPSTPGGDVLEQAARVAENPGFVEARDTEWDAGFNYAKRYIAAAIRALSPARDGAGS